MIWRVLADAVFLLHTAFVLFVVLGGLLALQWRNAAWLHLPAAAWGAAIEFGGWICPLTPLENRLRLLAGESGYSGGFIEHYLIPLLYPDLLTPNLQYLLGAVVVAANAGIYGVVLSRRRKQK